jgi:hypothetical protein
MVSEGSGLDAECKQDAYATLRATMNRRRGPWALPACI